MRIIEGIPVSEREDLSKRSVSDNLRLHLKACGLTGEVESIGREKVAVSLYLSGVSLFEIAAHAAFMDHRGFGIRPEVLMYLINHEIAQTVNKNPKKYRHLFTKTMDGKQQIKITDNSLVLGGNNDWSFAIQQFEAALEEHVPAGIMPHMLPKFSTHTTETRVSSLICFMDAAKAFYDYRVMTRCGIPKFILHGNKEDYTMLVNSAAALSEVFPELSLYFAKLLPILKKIEQQADDNNPIDVRFWSSFYNWNSGSGLARATGWHTNFFAYLRKDIKSKEFVLRGQEDYSSYGVTHNQLPCHVSAVPFTWEYLGGEIPMTFVGGVLAVDEENRILTPGLSYAVLRN